MSTADLPDEVVFKVHGSAGVLEKQEKRQNFLQFFQMIMQMQCERSGRRRVIRWIRARWARLHRLGRCFLGFHLVFPEEKRIPNIKCLLCGKVLWKTIPKK